MSFLLDETPAEILFENMDNPYGVSQTRTDDTATIPQTSVAYSIDIRSRFLSLGEMFVCGWGIFTGRLLSLAWISLIAFSVPAVSLVLNSLLQGEDLFITMLGVKGVETGRIALMLVFRVIEFVLSVFQVLAIAKLSEQTILGKFNGNGPLFREVWPQLGRGVVTYFLLILLMVLLTLALIIPAVVFGVYFLFAMQALALRNTGPTGALGYSRSVVEGRWLPAFLYYMALLFAVFIPVGVLQVGLPQLPWIKAAGLASAFSVSVAVTLLATIGSSLGSVFATVLFLNLDYDKQRKDGNMQDAPRDKSRRRLRLTDLE